MTPEDTAVNQKPPGFFRKRWNDATRIGKTAYAALGVSIAIMTPWQTFATPLGLPTPVQFVDHLLHPPPPSPVEQIDATVRYNQPDWGSQTTIDGGIDPHFDLQIDYKNVSGVDLSNVVVNVDGNGSSIPIEGTVLLIDDEHPRGISVNDDVLSASGMNIGTPKHPVHVRISYRVPTSDMRCGDNTMTFRAHVRTPDFNGDKPIDSQEAVVVYNNECPGPDGPIEKTLLPEPPGPATFVPSVVPAPPKP